MDITEQEAKLKLRLAQIEKHEKCQEDFLVFVKTHQCVKYAPCLVYLIQSPVQSD